MNLRNLSVGLTFAAILSGCSGTTSSPSSSTLTSGLTAVSAKLNEAAAVINKTSLASSLSPALLSSKSRDDVGAFTLGLDTVWTTGTVAGLYDGTNGTLKQWFTDEFNPNFLNSTDSKVTFVGRISNAMSLICYLGGLGFPVDSTNLPTVGTHTGTISTALATTCGEASAAGMNPTITVTATTDTTLYDRNISVNLGNNCPMLFKIRMNSTEINIATGEDQTCDGRDHASSAVVLYNKTTDVARFTYISKSFSAASGFEFYRGYYDGTADQAYILGTYGADDGTAGDAGLTAHVAYAVVGMPEAGGTVAVSAKVKGYGIADEVYNGCINPSNMTPTSSTATLACTMTGTDVATPYTDVIVASRAAKTTLNSIYQISETEGVGFTNSTDVFQ